MPIENGGEPPRDQKTSKWARLLGAGIVTVGALVGGIALTACSTSDTPRQATSTLVGKSDRSPEQQAALISAGNEIVKELDLRATAYFGGIESDKEAWDQALVVSATDPDQAARLLADSGSSRELFDLAVALNENVWTPEYTHATNKVNRIAFGMPFDFSVNAQTVKDYLVETGVYEKLPERADVGTGYRSMYETLNSIGWLQFASADQGVKHLKDTQQLNVVDIAPTFVQNGLLTQSEADAWIQGAEQYIANVDTAVESVNQ